MSDLQHTNENWEGFARTDPLWAILSDPTRKGGMWDLTEFFATGRAEIDTVISHLETLHVAPSFDGSAMDFGSGVGRLTQAMCERFARCVGVDAAPTMIDRANELNRFPGRCEYRLNQKETIDCFDTGAFDFIYSSIVLQHIPPADSERYIAEFLRLLRPGGLAVFQIPDSFKEPAFNICELLRRLLCTVRVRLALRQRLNSLLPHLFSIKARPPTPIYDADRFMMEMNCIPEPVVRRVSAEGNAEVLDVIFTNSTLPDFNGRLQYTRQEPTGGSISKQYVVRKLASHVSVH